MISPFTKIQTYQTSKKRLKARPRLDTWSKHYSDEVRGRCIEAIWTKGVQKWIRMG
ncbi:hypothetical protein HMPREF8571_0227 [Streptococcus mitis ATCC 6249]|jgi:hypothetical protein|uniref:Uncharacterized protein n=1 Tax=Streptococcus mitis ATCC 6249 TaxID=864567 RepID=E0PNW0_STRMT|nr:hypothetical protein HMPREF8571_0227 [Streptococcus mitis ATCC 6249]